MSDGLSVIRRVLDVDAPGTPAPATSPEASGAAEAAVLRQSLQALDALPAYAPDAAALTRVSARAAEASDMDALAPVRGALGLGPAQTGAEAAVLRQSLQALDALPPYAPEAASVRAAEAEALHATQAPLLAASGEAVSGQAAAAGPETALLRQSLQALDALPARGPDDAALAAVLARAAEATVAPVLAIYGETAGGESVDRPAEARPPEAALLAPSREALDALPRHAPSEAAVAAVLAFAAEATAEAAGTATTTAMAVAAPAAVTTTARPRQRRADDRAAASGAAGRRRVGLFAGFGTLAVALIAAIVLLRPGAETVAPAQQELALADVAPAPEAEPAESLAPPAPDPAPEAAAPQAAAPPPAFAARVAPRGPSGDGFEAVAAREAVARPAARSAAVPASAFVAEADAQDAGLQDAATEEGIGWETSDDVRLLSLRLQQLREQNAGIAWDEPAAPFGQASGAAGTTPGVQAVREGAPAGRAFVRPTAPADNDRR